MADCDAPGADAADRDEWQRLLRYQDAVQDAIRGVETVTWHPDTQAMADWLAGEGPNPVTVLGHSHGWRTTVAEEGSPDGSEGLTIRAITAGDLPGYLDSLLGEDRHTAAPAAPAGAPEGGDWMTEVLGLAKPVAGQAPAPYVPPHPVRPESRSTRPKARPPVRTHAVPGRERIWIDVPHSEKDTAKQRGAIWDPVAGSWYAPRPGMTALEPWARLPEVLPGEDRTLGQGLFVDLIPSTSWFRNVRAGVSPRDWERIRQMVYRRAGMRCEACGAAKDKARRRWLECHERWAYRAPAGAGSGVQSLRRLICLCSDCHACTHWGHLAVTGGPEAEQAAFGHLMSVTGMSAQQAGEHVDAAFHLWTSRSEREWTADLSLITRMGIRAGKPENGDAAWAS